MRSPLLFSKLEKPKVLSHSSQDILSSIVAFLLWTHWRTFTSFLNCGAQNCTKYSRWGHTSAEYSGIITSFDWLDLLCLMHRRVQFAPLAARAHCWLTLSLLSMSTPRSLSPELLSSHSSPSLHLCLAYAEILAFFWSTSLHQYWATELYSTGRLFWKVAAGAMEGISAVLTVICQVQCQLRCYSTVWFSGMVE